MKEKKQQFPSNNELKEVRKKLSKGMAARPIATDLNVVDKTKAELCKEFVIYLNRNELTQKQLADELGVDVAIVSKIVNYLYEDFTIDRLTRLLSIVRPKIELKIAI